MEVVSEHEIISEPIVTLAFGQQKTQMIFVTIRDEFAPKSTEGMEKMSKDF